TPAPAPPALPCGSKLWHASRAACCVGSSVPLGIRLPSAFVAPPGTVPRLAGREPVRLTLGWLPPAGRVPFAPPPPNPPVGSELGSTPCWLRQSSYAASAVSALVGGDALAVWAAPAPA